jgi:hypothetical protein
LRLILLRQSFQIFGNGVGDETLSKKGIIAVKIDLSSIKPSKLLYLFCAHLQVSFIYLFIATNMILQVSLNQIFQKCQTYIFFENLMGTCNIIFIICIYVYI